MPTCSVMLHNLHALQRARMHQRCIKVASLKVRSEACTMHQGCISDASTLHPRCIHVASTLQLGCSLVAAWLHQRCITVRVRKLQPSCNQAATLGGRCMYRSCTVHARYLWVAISRRYCIWCIMFKMKHRSVSSIGSFLCLILQQQS